MSKQEIDPKAIQRAWQKHNREHFQSFQNLDIRTKLSAIEGMADIVRRFQELHTQRTDNKNAR